MVSEKKNAFSNMTTRQKMTIAGLVIVVVVIIWQVIDMMSDQSTTTEITPVAATAQPVTATAPPAGTAPAATPATNAAAPAVVAQPAPPPAQPIVAPTVSADMQSVEMQRRAEREYVERVNQLQMLKVQREIEETNQAIASAKLATVTAQKGISDVLTRPSQPQQVPSFTPPPPVASSGPVTEIPVAPPVEAPTAYMVVSVSMLHGRWAAVLSSQGKLYNIVVGDVLPDSSVVRSINKYGVILKKDGIVRKLSMTSSV